MYLTKRQVIANLESEIETQMQGDKHARNLGKTNLMLLAMVNKIQLNDYNNVAINVSGGMNKGNVVENIMLYFKKLVKETANYEIKFLGNNTPNILTNSDTQVVYVVVNKANLKGVYKVNASVIFKQRLTLQFILDNFSEFTYNATYSKRLGLAD